VERDSPVLVITTFKLHRSSSTGVPSRTPSASAPSRSFIADAPRLGKADSSEQGAGGITGLQFGFTVKCVKLRALVDLERERTF